MWVKVLREFKWKNARGKETVASPGTMIDIMNRHDLKRLLSAGYVSEREPLPQLIGGAHGKLPVSNQFARTKRIGIWLYTSRGYSGGRIHMYQYALTLAQLGAEVYMITNAPPVWAHDYPEEPRLKILLEGKDGIPPDLDLIVTDSKHSVGARARAWKQRNPTIPFVCFNFETPNWVAEFDKEYAQKLQVSADIFGDADYLIANSAESLKYLLEWVKKPIAAGYLPPAVNDHAIGKGKEPAVLIPTRPFAVYSARAPKYKGGDVAVEAIWALDVPFDLVTFGHVSGKVKDTSLHKLHTLERHNDAEKFAYMKEAAVVLAPSKFEGYGMVPGEALASGTPCIVYDLPVLRQVYGDRLIYAKWGDRGEFKKMVKSFVDSGDRGEHPRVKPIVAEAKALYGLGAMKKKVETLKHHALKRPSISAHCIVYWGFVPEALESIYPHVDEIRIAYGPTELNKHVPPDGSLELLRAFPDPDSKITLEVRDVWRNKLDMRRWGTRLIAGNWHLLLDGDEIWVGLDKWIAAGFPFSAPRWVNLWHDADHWVYDSAKLAGRRWGRKLKPYGSVCPHYRWSWWRSSYKFSKHCVVTDFADRTLHAPEKIAAEDEPSCVIYHLGHMLPRETMKAKHEFYRKRDGDDPGRRQRQKVWHAWNGQLGDVGDGIVAKVDWELPALVKKVQVAAWA